MAIRAAADATALDPAIIGSAGAGVLEVSVPAEAAADSVADFVAVLRAGLEGLADGLPPRPGKRRRAVCAAGRPGRRGHVGARAVTGAHARSEGSVRSRAQDGARPVRWRNLIMADDAGIVEPLADEAPAPERPGSGRIAASAGGRLRALRVLPASLSDLPAVGRGDGLPAGPDPPDHPDPGNRPGQRGRRPSTSTGASAAWPA